MAVFHCPTRRGVTAYPYKSYQQGGTGGPPANYDYPNTSARSDYAVNGGSVNTYGRLPGVGGC